MNLKHSAVLTSFLAFTVTSPAGELNGKNFTTEDGWSLSLAAPASLVERPVEACFDDRGRLLVTDVSGTNAPPKEQLAQAPHRLLRLEDLDGDGVFETKTVFADKLGFPEGVLWHQGAAYVSVAPVIWKFTDADDDGVAEKREVWYDGKTLTGCANDLHGPYAGPDGLIYWCKGGFAEQTHTLPGGKELKSRASHVFRQKADRSDFDCVFTAGMDNPVCLAWLPEGDLIVCGTFLQHPADGRRDGLIHAVRGGLWGKDHDVLDGALRTGPLLPAMSHLGPAAPAGMCRLGADLLVCQFNLRKVSRHELKPAGSTWETTDHDFLACSDPDFHPTDVLQAPDGSALVVDTGGWYKICCPTSQTARPQVTGGIYRLKKHGGEISQKCPPPRWQFAQADPNPALMAKACDPAATLESREQAVAEILRPLAAAALSKNLHIRRQAIADLGQWPAGAGAKINPEARGGMGEITLAARAIEAPLLAAAALPDNDRFLEHAIIQALVEGADARGPRAFWSSDSPALQRMGIYWASQTDPVMVDDSRLPEFLGSADPGVREAAVFALGNVPDWRAGVIDWIQAGLQSEKPPESLGRALESVLQASPENLPMAEWLTLAKTETSRRLLLDWLARAQPAAAFPENLTQPLLAALGGTPSLLEPAATVLSAYRGRLPAPLLEKIGPLTTHADLPVSLQISLILALGPKEPAEAPFALLLAALTGNAAAPAAQALSEAKLTTPQLSRLARALPTAGLLSRPALLKAFRHATDETLGLELAAVLEKNNLLAGIPATDLKEATAKFPDLVKVRLAAAASRLTSGDGKQNAEVDTLVKSLPPGDPLRGKVVFQSPQASCSLCHQAGYLGKALGPDLSKIGSVRSRRDLVESIAFPSASFARSYEPVEVLKKDGATVYGIPRQQNQSHLTLTTGAVTPDIRLTAEEIQKISPGAYSLMPQGLDKVLGTTDLADLVAFLESLR